MTILINLYLPLPSCINCLREFAGSLLSCPRKTQFCFSLHFRHAIITCNTHKIHARAQTTALVSNTILPKLNSSEKEVNNITAYENFKSF